MPEERQRFSTRGDEGALAGVLPATAQLVVGPGAARRGLTADEGVGARPDVALADDTLRELTSDAPVVVVSCKSALGLLDGGSRAADAALRFAGYALSSRRASVAARQLYDHGFRNIEVIHWDHRQPFPRLGRRAPAPLWHSHRYPRRALVLANRDENQQSILDAALAAAGAAEPEMIRVSEAALIALTESSVVRVAVGAGQAQVRRPMQVTRILQAVDPNQALSDRMPWVTSGGSVGLGAWSVERRLPGTRPTPPLSAQVLDDCQTVLVELFELRTGTATTVSSTCHQEAAKLAAFLPADVASSAVRLAGAADRVLVDSPRGFGHGDFWYENLLVDAGRLTGVIDWDSAGPGRLPLLDLVHLLLSAHRSLPGYHWGPALLDVLVPWADRGADDLGRRYCRQLGLDPRPVVLRAFVIAYWLDWLNYQFDRYADRPTRSRWMANNVIRVARTLDAAGWSHL